MQFVALVFQPMLSEARRLAEGCADAVRDAGYAPRLVSAWELDPSMSREGVSLAVTFGGDGTIIRAARWLAGTNTPILGVAMGKLGFLTELPPAQIREKLPSVLAGNYWADDRVMVSARVESLSGKADVAVPGVAEEIETAPLIALNEVVVARGAFPRAVQIEVSVDGAHLVRYVADGLIVATPTGSTAYALAAGGPVLAPHAPGLVLVPVAAHLAALRSLVIPLSSRVEVVVSSPEQSVVLVLDGQRQIPLGSGHRVIVEAAKERTRFARLGSPSRFYETLVASLKKR